MANSYFSGFQGGMFDQPRPNNSQVRPVSQVKMAYNAPSKPQNPISGQMMPNPYTTPQAAQQQPQNWFNGPPMSGLGASPGMFQQGTSFLPNTTPGQMPPTPPLGYFNGPRF